jgi:hypothetical protein
MAYLQGGVILPEVALYCPFVTSQVVCTVFGGAYNVGSKRNDQ